MVRVVKSRAKLYDIIQTAFERCRPNPMKHGKAFV
jgi:hypothetical protein